MEPRGSMSNSQGLSNNPYSEPNQPNSSYWQFFVLYTQASLKVVKTIGNIN